MAVMETVILGVFTGGLLLLVGGVLLQIFLSKRESRWPGLVLPLLAFLQSLLLPLNVMDTGSVSQNILLVLVTLLELLLAAGEVYFLSLIRYHREAGHAEQVTIGLGVFWGCWPCFSCCFLWAMTKLVKKRQGGAGSHHCRLRQAQRPFRRGGPGI